MENSDCLPNDLKKFVKNKITKRLLFCLSLLLIFGTVLYFFGTRIFNSDIPEFNTSGHLLVMLLPFVISGVPFKMIDRTYCGKLIDTEVKITVDNESGSRPTRDQLYWKKTVILTIELDNGKIIERKAFEGKRDSKSIAETIKKGSRIFHLYGTGNVVALPDESDTHMCCAVCGTVNEVTCDTCESCGHTLLKKI